MFLKVPFEYSTGVSLINWQLGESHTEWEEANAVPALLFLAVAVPSRPDHSLIFMFNDLALSIHFLKLFRNQYSKYLLSIIPISLSVYNTRNTDDISLLSK